MTDLEKALQLATKLPVEAQLEAALFIDHLAKDYAQRRIKKPKSVPLQDEPFAGMWKDREDLKDSAAWVRDLRQKEWRG